MIFEFPSSSSCLQAESFTKWWPISSSLQTQETHPARSLHARMSASGFSHDIAFTIRRKDQRWVRPLHSATRRNSLVAGIPLSTNTTYQQLWLLLSMVKQGKLLPLLKRYNYPFKIKEVKHQIHNDTFPHITGKEIKIKKSKDNKDYS